MWISGCEWSWLGSPRQGDQAQHIPQPFEEEREVAAGGGEDGVDGIAVGMGEVIAADAVLGLDVADHRLCGRTPPHLVLDRRRHATLS